MPATSKSHVKQLTSSLSNSFHPHQDAKNAGEVQGVLGGTTDSETGEVLERCFGGRSRDRDHSHTSRLPVLRLTLYYMWCPLQGLSDAHREAVPAKTRQLSIIQSTLSYSRWIFEAGKLV